jgi:hypothetical protein
MLDNNMVPFVSTMTCIDTWNPCCHVLTHGTHVAMYWHMEPMLPCIDTWNPCWHVLTHGTHVAMYWHMEPMLPCIDTWNPCWHVILQHYTNWSFFCLLLFVWLVGLFSPRYNWNIVDSGVKYHNPLFWDKACLLFIRIYVRNQYWFYF